MPGGQAFRTVRDQCPRLRAAFCSPSLGRGFPFLIAGEADETGRLQDFRKESRLAQPGAIPLAPRTSSSRPANQIRPVRRTWRTLKEGRSWFEVPNLQEWPDYQTREAPRLCAQNKGTGEGVLVP